MRKKKQTKVHHNDLLVGDIVKIKAGMNIPVDGLIIQCSGVSANESAMTGEPEELAKDTLEGCKVRKAEKDEEFALTKTPNKRPKDLPSPVLLSGT